MKSTSSFLVSKLRAESLLPSLIDVAVLLKRVKMAETVYDLSQPSMFTTTFPSKQGSSFFFPLGNLPMCDRKHESASPAQIAHLYLRSLSQSQPALVYLHLLNQTCRTRLSPFAKPIKSRRSSRSLKHWKSVMHLPSFAKPRKAVRVYYCKEPCQLPQIRPKRATRLPFLLQKHRK